MIELIAINPFEIAAKGRVNHLAFQVENIEHGKITSVIIFIDELDQG
ncbi:hypothetical protein [Paenibacillus gansuensis]|uniref:Uncharacterized protein n=1 Tax=Paenibacillus gansuensis TaxID=306542 RepID=A0ABW5PH61_9BACL